jgi:hypothetical protein
MAVEKVDLPIKNGDIPVMLVYQRVCSILSKSAPPTLLRLSPAEYSGLTGARKR